MGEEAEDEGGGDLVGCIGDADVEVGQIGFDKVADDDFEFTLFWSGLGKKNEILRWMDQLGRRTFPEHVS